MATAENNVKIEKKGNIFSARETMARLGDSAVLCVQSNQLMYFLKKDGYKQAKPFNESFNERHSRGRLNYAYIG